MFEISHLRCFVAVADELHFGRAATRLNMTQPPLSRQIQLLEHALGAQLLDRANRRVRLTPLGRTFLPQAQRLLQFAEGAVESIQRAARGDAGTVTIGFTAASGYDFLPHVIHKLRTRLPEVSFVLKEAVTATQLEALASGRLDIALVRPPISPTRYLSRVVLREPMILALPAEHRLSGHEVIDLTEVGDEPVIGYSSEARYFHDLVHRLFSSAGALPNLVQQVSQIHSVLALVRTGLGVALVPEAARRLGFEGVVYRNLTPLTGNGAELFAAWRPGDEQPVVRRVLDIFLESPVG
ncbi:LysR family transcriptional regulator [Pigmentiphaga aceris]|uniref:LysR family transcriptional regulator n=1 Tax=Pigmentiphaga aceris TaxID=1940612 RepID=A0A5C0AXB4_9BURK|nr:LysR family transcriptional regulator [Pigmentiphaga aceris]QEI07069.1 LysR family transcriptional regulator [Pigmentiphaga aceris]